VAVGDSLAVPVGWIVAVAAGWRVGVSPGFNSVGTSEGNAAVCEGAADGIPAGSADGRTGLDEKFLAIQNPNRPKRMHKMEPRIARAASWEVVRPSSGFLGRRVIWILYFESKPGARKMPGRIERHKVH
jgi:hypothetical protein